MRIGIIGAGNIGAVLAEKLSAAGHDVKIANSRGPESLDKSILSTGATAATSQEAVRDVDVVILSVPIKRIPDVRSIVAEAPSEAVIIDTSNYYPSRDSAIKEIEDGVVESEWVSRQLGVPIVKAWNAIGSHSLREKGMPAGAAGRISIPVAGTEADFAIVKELIDDTGFDAYYTGSVADSWRQQPGTPCYTTDLTADEFPSALAAADRSRSASRRDLAVAAIAERMGDSSSNPDSDYNLRLCRALFM
jgi:hypothetical protein